MTPMELRNEGVWQATLPAEDRRQLEADDGLPNGPVDVLVVGGGIIGLAVAHQLSLKKQRVQVIERGLPGDGATGAGAGGIWPSDQGPQHPAGFAPLALASRDLWGRLSLQPDFAIEWRVNGFLTVNSNRFGGDAPSYATAAQEAGYTVHAVDGDQIAQLEPNLKPGWAAGVHCASDAHLNPLRGAASLLRAGRKKGVRLATRTELTELRQAGGRVTTVQTTRGEVSAGNVVVCTGAGITLLSGRVRPVSGQLIATAPQPPLLKGTVGGGVPHAAAEDRGDCDGRDPARGVRHSARRGVVRPAAGGRVGSDPEIEGCSVRAGLVRRTVSDRRRTARGGPGPGV